MKVAISDAARNIKGKIKYVQSFLEHVQMERGKIRSEYSVDLERCSPGDEDECGSLAYSVETLGSKPDCKVLRVDLEGEE